MHVVSLDQVSITSPAITPPSSAPHPAASLATRFSDLCRYLSLPKSVDALFEEAAEPVSLMRVAER